MVAVGSGRVRETKRFLNGTRKAGFARLRKTGSFEVLAPLELICLASVLLAKILILAKGNYLPWFSIIIARTFMDRPNRLMKPSASLWLYRSPVAKEAMDSLYRL